MKFYLEQDLNNIYKRIKNEISQLEGKTIVLAGAKGFLGRYFIEIFKLINNNLVNPVNLVGIDNFISSGDLGKNYDDSVGEWWSFHNINLADSNISLNFIKDAEYIIHAAGIASPFYYRANPLLTLDVAVNGSRSLLNLAKEFNAKYVYFSSSEIYGDPDPLKVPINEEYRGNVSTMGPRACYDESKRLGETLCYIYSKSYGLHTNIIRPFNVFGPGMQSTDYRVMPNFAYSLKNGADLNVYGSGKQTRTFCYIEDAIVGFIKVIVNGKHGESYNIGNDKPEISMHDLAKIMIDIDGKKVKTNISDYPESYPEDEPERRCPDLTKSKKDLSYFANVELKDGLSRFLKWTYDNF